MPHYTQEQKCGGASSENQEPKHFGLRASFSTELHLHHAAGCFSRTWWSPRAGTQLPAGPPPTLCPSPFSDSDSQGRGGLAQLGAGARSCASRLFGG